MSAAITRGGANTKVHCPDARSRSHIKNPVDCGWQWRQVQSVVKGQQAQVVLQICSNQYRIRPPRRYISFTLSIIFSLGRLCQSIVRSHMFRMDCGWKGSPPRHSAGRILSMDVSIVFATHGGARDTNFHPCTHDMFCHSPLGSA